MSWDSANGAMNEGHRTTLLQRISKSLKDGSLELPSLPDVALEVRSAATERELGVAELTRVIQQDPGLSAYLVRVSNSAQYQRLRPADTLLAAVSRLGRETTRDVASSYAIRTLFHLRSPQIRGHLREVWQRSVYTASLAHVMAKRCGFPPERALLGGLLQDIGALPLLSELREFPELVAEPAVVQELLARFAGKISGLVLNAWGFDQEMVVVGLEREHWWRDRKPAAELADLILVARYHTYLGEEGAGSVNLPRLSELPAFAKLSLGELGPEQGLVFLREARQEVEALRQALA